MSEKKWKTKIADSTEKGAVIRGYALDDIIDKITFTEMIHLILLGRLPAEAETKMLDAILTAIAEHGIATPSATAARIAASGSGSFVQSVAAGLLATGKYHGAAIEGAMKMLHEGCSKMTAEEIVNKFSSAGERLPGYGHKIYKEDPRAMKLMKIARESGIAGKCCKVALEIEMALEKSRGKKLCLNADGAIAAILSDMGFDWRMGNAFFVIARTVGLSAHVYEELTVEKPFGKRLEESEYDYIGESGKKLPATNEAMK